MGTIGKKLKTLLALAKEGKIRAVVQALASNLLLVTRYRLDELDVDAYILDRFHAKIPLESRAATSEDMQSLFEHWPDSREEYERHHEVYYKWGFKTCFLSFHRETGEVVHFQFLLTREDLANVQRFLPGKRKLYRFLSCDSCAYRGWVYTFEKFRAMGVSLEATDSVIRFCKQNGIGKLYSHRGFGSPIPCTTSRRSAGAVAWTSDGDPIRPQPPKVGRK